MSNVTVTQTGGAATAAVTVSRGLQGAQGPAGATGPTGATGAAGPNSVTSATTSDGTCVLSIQSLQADQLSSAGESTYIDLVTHSLNESGTKRVDWANLQLNSGNGSSNELSVDWGNRYAADSFSQTSFDWENRQLLRFNGFVSEIVLDWSNGSVEMPQGASTTSGAACLFPAAGGTLALTNDPRFEPQVKSANFTAANGETYHVVASATVTDPAPVEGKGFTVFVRNGTATVGGTAYATSGSVIIRTFHSGSWANRVYNETPVLGANVSTALSTAVGSAGAFVVNGGTLTDMTYAGSAAFTSTTRPTSGGTGTPAATSLITRADGDARFSQVVGASLTDGVDSDENTTTYKTVSELSFALEIGTYYIDAVLVHNGNASYATAGVKDRLDFSGTATASGSVYRVLDNATTSSSVPNGRLSANTMVESAPTNRSQTTWRKGVLTVTAAGTLSVQIAQSVAVAGANTTLAAGSHLIVTRLI